VEARAGSGASRTTWWREGTTVDVRSDSQITPDTNSGRNDYTRDYGSTSRNAATVVFSLVESYSRSRSIARTGAASSDMILSGNAISS